MSEVCEVRELVPSVESTTHQQQLEELANIPNPLQEFYPDYWLGIMELGL